jgi:hypothetical protein
MSTTVSSTTVMPLYWRGRPGWRTVVVAGHEVVGHAEIRHHRPDARLLRVPEAGEVAGVDDGGHVEAAGEVPGEGDAERVEVDVAHVQ